MSEEGELSAVVSALVSAVTAVRGMGEGVDRGYMDPDDPQLLAAVERERDARAQLETSLVGLRERGDLGRALADARADVRAAEAALDASGEERFGGFRRHRIARSRALLDAIAAGDPPIVR